jgi:cytoskeletal protein RodZ
MTPAELSTTTLGGHLRALRETKGSSLEDMARSTRVGIRHLEALEEERLADLPAPVFVRGFIRAYCGFLREAPDTALAQYEVLAGERAAAQAVNAPPRPRTMWAPSSVVVGLVLLVVLGTALIVVNLTVKRTGGTSVAAQKMDVSEPVQERAPAPKGTGPAETPRPTVPPVPRAATPPSSTPAAMPAPAPTPVPAVAKTPAGSQHLVIRAVDPTWIRVQPDEGRATEELLPAGASREWSAERRFLVTIGNAGGVEVALNGKVLPPLGPKGTVVHRLELPQAPASGS